MGENDRSITLSTQKIQGCGVLKTLDAPHHKGRRRNTVPTQTSREDTLHKKPAGVRISARHPAGSEAVVEGFEPPLAFTPNIISSDAPSAARTHHQL